MKSNSLTVSLSRSRENGLFSWQTVFAVVLTLKNRLPEPWQDIIPVNNVAELKMVVKLISVLMGAFLMAGLYDTILIAEGGAL